MLMMMDIAICDDAVIFTTSLEELVETLGNKYNKDVTTEVFFDGEKLVKHIKNGKRYDLIYLDIEMAGKNGVDTAHDIRLVDPNVLIIYVTNHECFAKEAFEVSAFRFLVKPVDKAIFEKYFVSAIKELSVSPVYFEYQYNKVHHKIPISQIIYFQSDRRVTYIITEDGISKCYEKIKDIEKRLRKSDVIFLRTHQSFLVNPDYIDTYMYDSIKLFDNSIISISIKRRKEVGEQYCQYKGEKVID